MELAMTANEARVNVTYEGRNFDLEHPLPMDSTDLQVLATVRECAGVDVSSGYVIDRKPADEVYPFARFIVRPSVSFG